MLSPIRVNSGVAISPKPFVPRSPFFRSSANARLPIAHTRIVFADDGADANIFSRKVPGLLTLTESSPASAVVDELTPLPGEFVVRKTQPSAFAGTGRAVWLSTTGIRTLVVCGCVTSGCIRASVLDAMQGAFCLLSRAIA
jgi:maleamate amidohydrolase